MPHFHREIIPQGALFTNVRHSNFQFHMPSVYAMLTGKSHETFSLGQQLEGKSIFQHLRIDKKIPKSKVWSVGLWGKLNQISTDNKDDSPAELCDVPGHFLRCYQPNKELYGTFLKKEDIEFIETYTSQKVTKKIFWPPWNSWSDIQFRWFEKVLDIHKPIFTLYALQEPETAHFSSWADYLINLAKADQRVYSLWKKTQNMPEYQNNTYFIIAVDHERDRNNSTHYEANLGFESKTWIYLWGPNIKSNWRSETEVQLTDVFSLLAELFSVPLEKHIPSKFKDAFKQ